MSEKSEGLYKKYEVTKISNPEKKVDAIVLEFDDPIGRETIVEWAIIMHRNGYIKAADDAMLKMLSVQRKKSKDPTDA